jgi:hypothetical protein
MNTAAIKRLKTQAEEVNMLFYMGVWKKYFTEHQVKLIIAEALTYCVKFEQVMIKGYLITNRKLCVIWICEEEQLSVVLFTFYKQVRKGIREQWHKLKKREAVLSDSKKEIEVEELLNTLFYESSFKNDWVLQLITGKKIELPYNNPDLERLKDYIAHSNFCSAIDYLGGVGPVKMTKNKKDN